VPILLRMNTRLPEWPARTIAVLATAAPDPHAIPVSAPVRAGDRRILLSLRSSRGSLARLRASEQVALLVLAEGDVAFTARGRASVVQAPLPGAPDYVAVAIDVDEIDDHRQPEFRVDSGVGREWVDVDERRALGERVAALAAMGDG
jgi:hypothetical protein